MCIPESMRQPFLGKPPSALVSSQELTRPHVHALSSLPRGISTSTRAHIPHLCLTPLHISPALCQLLLAKQSKPWQLSEAFPSLSALVALPSVGLGATVSLIPRHSSCKGHSHGRKMRCPIGLHVLYSISSCLCRNYSY